MNNKSGFAKIINEAANFARKRKIIFPLLNNSWFVLTVGSLLPAILLLVTNWRSLHLDVIPFGDEAIDEIVIQRARHGLLLVGHYSRFGFNHPGPFFFYTRHFAEAAVGWAFPSVWETHQAAILAVNGLFIGIAAMAAHGLAGGGRGGLLAALGTITIVFFQFHGTPQHGLTSPWMPDIIRMPYLAFLLQILWLARGSSAALVMASFCAAALVHGYVSMPAFVVPLWLWSLWRGYLTRRRQGQILPVTALVCTAAILALFIAPLLLDSLLNTPGNLERIIQSLDGPPHITPWPDVLRYTVGHWRCIRPFLWVIPVIAIVLDRWAGEGGAEWLRSIACSIVSTGIFFVYIRYAPPPLLDYIGYFYESVPLLLLTVSAIRLARHIAVRRWLSLVGLGVCGWGLSLGGGQIGYLGWSDVRVMTDQIVAASPSHRAVIEIGEHDLWPLLAALLVDADRFGTFACAPFPPTSIYAVIFPSERICGNGHDLPRFRLVRPEQCQGKCSAINAVGGLIRPAPLPPLLPGEEK